MTEQLELERRLVDQLESQAARRVVEAREDFYAAARAYGLRVDYFGDGPDVDELLALHVPLALRVDAWLERSRRTLRDLDQLRRWCDRLARPVPPQ